MIRSLTLAFFLLAAAAASAQPDVPVIRSNQPVVSIREGDVLRENAWRLSPETNPDVYEAFLENGKPKKIAFITDVDSIAFDVEAGRTYDFVIAYGEARCNTRIVGRRLVPAANFDARYRKETRGRTFVEIPAVYELVNVAVALTPSAIDGKGLVFQDSAYYTAMRKWFDPYRDHPLIARLEETLQKTPDLYFSLKMNAYAFELDRHGRIVRSRVYDRTGFVNERENRLLPWIDALQSFSDATKFPRFYAANRKTYDEQIAFYRDDADVAAMKRWLDRNFPGTRYDTYKIVFSPLVGFNQSATWLESNGHRELQAHVNFPYTSAFQQFFDENNLSDETRTIVRGQIAFTELNHGYINPEADKHAARALKAISNRDLWVDSSKGRGYYGGIGTFNEYMNWALVNLYAADHVAPEEQEAVFARVEKMMVERRGFPRFAEFNRFLIDLYRGRKAGRTLADLYPAIIEWFERRNAA